MTETAINGAAAPRPTPETYDTERRITNLFMQLKGVKTMLQYFDLQIAEGNDEHSWGQSTLFMVEEFERMLEEVLQEIEDEQAQRAERCRQR